MNETTPEVSPLLILFGLFIMMLMFGSFLGWISAITWLRMGGKSIPVEPRRPAPWGLIHFVGIFVLFIVIGGITIRLFDTLVFNPFIAQYPEDQQDGLRKMGHMFSGSFSQIITMIVASFMIVFSTRATAADLGWSLKHIGYDIVIGLGASILFLPIIQVIMASLVYLLDQKYDHPLLEALSSGPVLLMYSGAFFAAVIAAPITEEFLFRVILQGLLEANATSNFSWQRLILGDMLGEPQLPVDGTTSQVYSDNPSPYRPPTQSVGLSGFNEVTNSAAQNSTNTFVDPVPKESSYQADPRTSVPMWPLFVSGTLFGLAHAEYGPSWIPLILMGLVLGYLYRCTHRIWACWIVHISLNAISMIGFGLQLLSGNPISTIWQWLGY